MFEVLAASVLRVEWVNVTRSREDAVAEPKGTPTSAGAARGADERRGAPREATGRAEGAVEAT